MELSKKDKLFLLALVLDSGDSEFGLTKEDEKLYMNKMKKVYNYDENTSDEKLEKLESIRIGETKEFIDKLREEIKNI